MNAQLIMLMCTVLIRSSLLTHIQSMEVVVDSELIKYIQHNLMFTS